MTKIKTLLTSLGISTLALSSALAAPAQAPVAPAGKPVIPALVVPLTPYAQLYKVLKVTKLWTDASGMKPEVLLVRDVLMNAKDELLSDVFWTPSLEQMVQNYSHDADDRLEVEVTEAMVKYVMALSAGKLDPQSVAENIKIAKKTVPYDALARMIQNTTADLKTGLASFAPKWPAYGQLKELYQRLSVLTPAEYPDVPDQNRSFDIGKSYPVIAAAKTRMKVLGYWTGDTSPVYGRDFYEAVKVYYKEQALQGSVQLSSGSEFWRHLGTPVGSRIQQILTTVEKIRWYKQMPANGIMVNLALQKFRLFEDSQLTMEFKTINGRADRKTPLLEDRISMIEMNPDWTAPESLVRKDKAKAIMADPGYLDRGHFTVVSDAGQPIDPYYIDWQTVANGGKQDFLVRQEPGLGNALGIMKFHLTNPYAIYLHDTNERNLFSENYRLRSSGCIRLEQPVELAKYLLRNDPIWSQPFAIEDQLAKEQVAEYGIHRKLQVPLKQSMPVFLMHMTVEAEAGKPVKFANDYYGLDTEVYYGFHPEKRPAPVVPMNPEPLDINPGSGNDIANSIGTGTGGLY